VVDQILRPASAAGFAFELVLGGELVAGAVGDDVALEIRLAPEQPEAVLDPPIDRDAGLGLRRVRPDGLGIGLGIGAAVKAGRAAA
jgi:hypothetical protein